jgi:septation ring formation regulator EzrA
MASCRQKEAELLEFSATLTEKNVGLQSDLRCAEARLEHLENELSFLRRRVADLESERSDVEARSRKLAEDLESERRDAAQCRSAAAKEAKLLETRVMELEDEVKLLRKRNAAGIKVGSDSEHCISTIICTFAHFQI